MAVSGFEGFEKRLELRFSGDDPLGLRRLAVDALQEVLEAVQCSIVSAAGNRSFDAYILSESSLFLYPHKVIIKTCGTTQLLRSIPCLLRHTAGLGLTLLACRYSRGSFIFPSAQPAPHTSFADEVLYLDDRLPPSLTRRRKACVLPCAAAAAAAASTHSSWHVYSAAAAEGSSLEAGGDAALEFEEFFTVEVCMTELDRTLAERFFRREGDDRSGDAAGAEMTASTGIGGINPGALVCGFAFEPCGYSMNGLDRDRYSTIHVTPEDGHSYASYEGVGRWGPGPGGAGEVVEPLRRVIRVFAPGAVSVSVCMRKQLLLQGARPAGEGDQDQEPEEEEKEDRGVWSAIASALEPLGLTCRSRAAENFPGAGAVTYQTFTARRK